MIRPGQTTTREIRSHPNPVVQAVVKGRRRELHEPVRTFPPSPHGEPMRDHSMEDGPPVQKSQIANHKS